MRYFNGQVLHSASDLANFLDCAHLTALDLLALLTPELAPERTPDGDEAALMQAHGFAHEERYLHRLRQAGRSVTNLKNDQFDLDKAVTATMEAMQRGDDVIYQAALWHGKFAGYADFLVRTPGASKLGDWHYEVADTKLAHSPKAKFMIQLCFYVDLLEQAQGRTPERVHLYFGDGGERSFRSADYLAYFANLRRRYLAFTGQNMQETYPNPVPRCDLCHWREACEARLLTDDHLSQVANISRRQTSRLQDEGVVTMAALADLSDNVRIPKMNPDTLSRLCQQARLQCHKRKTGKDCYELLPPEPARGFFRLPKPDTGDLFFDMEGDPYEEGGLEYLFGAGTIESGQFRFHDFWAHNRAEERRAFESFIDFAIARLKQFPAAHIYHYASYEETALKRLMSSHGTREAEVDYLLRNGKLVDLYKVVREGLRVSEPRYSIKNLETFYTDKRTGEVKSSGASIVWYERWKETNDHKLLADIGSYNEDDCRSTWQLRQWLLELRPAGVVWYKNDAAESDSEPTEPNAWDLLLEKYRSELLGELPADLMQWDDGDRMRELAYQLLDFYRRETKPQWWGMFARMEMSGEELLEDVECLAGLTIDRANPPRLEKRSIIYTWHYPEQETKLKSGDEVTNAATGEPMGKLTLDEDKHLASLKIATSKPQPEEHLSLGPGNPYNTKDQQAALLRFADSLIAGDSRYPALEAVLMRNPPRLEGFRLDSATALSMPKIIAAVEALDHSYLVIQGPPGAGKTWTGSHLIVKLLRRGKRIAVASNSHKAINNLLAAVEKVALEEKVTFQGIKKSTATDPDSFHKGRLILDVTSGDDIATSSIQLIAGTAWLFSKQDFDQMFDYLFVDEAGQVCLANLIAIGVCAKNIVLLGDPMQLGQPTQGVHPGHSGESGMEYLLDGRATVQPERGVFLPTSWRMAPAVCRFISNAVYDGRLHPEAANANQKLVLSINADPVLVESGIRFLPISHNGNSQRSTEEANRIAQIYDNLLLQHFTDRNDRRRGIDQDDILVVAPYNMQVNLLRKKLPQGARIGTVDKFQGQEAPVVIVSMATSSEEYMPRDVGFLFSKNRLNVAISRAQCLAVVVASPRLLTVKCNTVEQMALVNLLCWVAREGEL